MKALLIEFNLQTSKRSGDINPRDPGLRCIAQNLESSPAKEIRVVEDERDIGQYQGIPGVTILNTNAEINAAIDREMPVRYSKADPELYRVGLEKLAPDKLREFAGRETQEILRKACEMGIPGVVKRMPQKLPPE